MNDLQAAAERVRAEVEPRRRWAATLAGLALVVGLSALDAAWDDQIASTVVIGPFLTALVATVRQTAAVAAAALAAVLLVGLAGGLVSVTAARRQERAAVAEALGVQLSAALSNLAEAVVVQGEDQRI